MTLSFTKEVIYSQDFERLNQILQEMVGKECWEVRASYPRVIWLSIGAKYPFYHPKLKRTHKGEWSLGVAFFNWRIDSPHGLVTDKAELEEIEFGLEPKLNVLADTVITAFELDPQTYGAKISFNNNHTLTLSRPADFAEYEDDYPNWLVLTPPDRWHLEVFANSTWSYTPKGMPIKDDDNEN